MNYKHILVSLSFFSQAILAAPAPLNTSTACNSLINTTSSHHQIIIDGKPLNYTATIGTLPIYNENNQCVTNVSYVAYQADSSTTRPLTFFYNGGPGTPSTDLNFLAFGPYIAHVTEKNRHFSVTRGFSANQETWLSFTDEVFIDAVGTGWGQQFPQKNNEPFYSVKGDISAFSQAIHEYIQLNQRWSAPIYLSGESYGGFRTPGVINELKNYYGINVEAAVLISPLFNLFHTDNGPNRLLPLVLALPSYTATALYHQKLSADLQKNPEQTLRDAEHWATTTYLIDLFQGDQLSADDQKQLLNDLQKYTGLPANLISNYQYRIPVTVFQRQLLAENSLTLGNLDSRFTQMTYNDSTYYSADSNYDPMSNQIDNAISPTIINYFYNQLKVKPSRHRYVFDAPMADDHWQWFDVNELHEPQEPEMLSTLRNNLASQPNLRIFVAAGLYDLATPYMSQRFGLNQLSLTPKLQQQIQFTVYPSGHMIYLSEDARKKLYTDVKTFYQK